jgi:hypothetical protein
MRKGSLSLQIILCASLLAPFVLAHQEQEYELDLSEFEKKPYHVGGFFELEPILFGLDQNAAFHRLNFFEQDEGGVTEQVSLGIRLEGSYQKGLFSAFARAESFLRHDYLGWNTQIDLLEGYVTLKPNLSFALDVGKKVTKWGTGYARNPVSFVDRPKDPLDPQEALEGFYLLKADIIKSFDGPLKTLAFTPVVLPVTEGVNLAFGKPNHVNFASKLYLLLWDTDVDLLFFTGESRTTRYGLDFARNVRSNLEVHGELAWITESAKELVDTQGSVSVKESDVLSTLLGVRFLTPTQLTLIAEYFHNGTGASKDEFQSFLGFVERAYENLLVSGSSELLEKAQSLRGTFAEANPMRDYMYFRASQKEPFGLLYFTPGLISIINLQDRSFLLMPELQYSPITNLVLRFRAAFLVGDRNTEFGEKRNDYKLELRVRYFF